MVAFSLGSFDVYRYGLFYLASFLIGYGFLWYIGSLGGKGKISFLQKYPKVIQLLSKNLDDLMLGIILGVLIGGRLGHVILYNFGYYLQHPNEILALWQGGMSFIGGIIGVVVAILILKRLYRLSGKEFILIFDIILLVVPIGIILGRFGNFLNQELYGIAIDPAFSSHTVTMLKNFWMVHVYPQIDTILRWNTNFFALLLEGVVIWLTLFCVARNQYKKNIRKVGKITILFLILYTIIRFGLEYIRQDAQNEFVGLFTITQWCMIAIWIGIVIVVIRSRRSRKEK